MQAKDVALAVDKPDSLLGTHDSHVVGRLEVGQVVVIETDAAAEKVLNLVVIWLALSGQ